MYQPTSTKKGIDEMKSTRKKSTKKTAQAEPFTSASLAAEDIEEPAGEMGRIAHIFFFSSRDFPPFLRAAVEDAIARAAVKLNLPNPDETKDDRTAFQQLIDLFRAAGDDFILTDDAEHEAEFLARVLEYRRTPKAIKATIRVLMWGVCANLADRLKSANDPTPELVRALYPTLKRNNPDQVGAAFNLTFDSIGQDAPAVMNFIAKDNERREKAKGKK